MEENKTIQMRLESVTEVSFSMSPAKFDENNVQDMQLGFSSAVAIDIEQNSLKLTFGVMYSQHNATIVECVYDFVFSVVDLHLYIEHESGGSIVIKDIMPHFLSVAVGTMRGILVVKSAGTAISKFPIPMVDVNQLNTLLGAKQNN